MEINNLDQNEPSQVTSYVPGRPRTVIDLSGMSPKLARLVLADREHKADLKTKKIARKAVTKKRRVYARPHTKPR